MRDPEPETHDATTWEDDFETLVFDRDDVNAALRFALAELGDTPVRPRLEIVAGGEDDELDELLEGLPPEALAVLAAARHPVPANAPRIPFAVANP